MKENIEPAFTLETIDKDIKEAEYKLGEAQAVLKKAMDDYNKATVILAGKIEKKELMLEREYENK